MKIAYFDCFSGISGDMTVGAFLDAGLSFAALKKELAKLKLKGYEIKAAKVKRRGLAGTKFDCVVSDKTRHGHRSVKEITALIDRSALSERAKRIAKDIFAKIGKAEAAVHGAAKTSAVHLHELADTDSIVDIVGTAIAVDELGIDEFYASEITMGERAVIGTEHGNLPVPGPATLELLKGAPIKISGIEAELVTPTGAGILRTLAGSFGRMPRMEVSSVGYGAGAMDLKEMPNMLRVMIGEAKPDPFKEDRIYVIETNIDDMNPQNFEYLFERLFKVGALDAYTTAIQMKKSRPAFKLTVLAPRDGLERVSSVIFSETTTIGLRFYEAERFKLERKEVTAKTRYGEVNVKLSKAPGGVYTASPEYDECVRIARAKNVPLKLIYDEAKKMVKV